ncbi:GNAT family N-acetyltransferase [Streptomyces sp. HK10]|uniref:GNAT family N-acetyltransferase n=1 Tax=Streptomyces sp. HK10 TaxID=3373255 RepID=UPI0037495A7B
MTYPNPRLAAYRPGTGLDDQLAALGYACIHGWPDQRPITPALVRSRLRPPSKAAALTLLATVHTTGGELIAAAALRHSAAPGGTGRLWGPLVHPAHQRRGLGTRLLHTLAEPIAAFPGTAATAEIPAQRTAAGAFFTRHHWQPTAGATLLKATLPLPAAPPANPAMVALRAPRPGEDLTEPLGQLYAAARPEEPAPAATGAWDRWRSDERYTPHCLTLAHDSTGCLLAAALVYPLAHTTPGEPAEALLGDLLLRPPLTPDRLDTGRQAAAHAVAAAHRLGAATARAVIPDHHQPVADCLTALGFTTTAPIGYWHAPTAARARNADE